MVGAIRLSVYTAARRLRCQPPKERRVRGGSLLPMHARRSAPGAYMPRTRAKQSTPLTPNLQTAEPAALVLHHQPRRPLSAPVAISFPSSRSPISSIVTSPAAAVTQACAHDLRKSHKRGGTEPKHSLPSSESKHRRSESDRPQQSSCAVASSLRPVVVAVEGSHAAPGGAICMSRSSTNTISMNTTSSSETSRSSASSSADQRPPRSPSRGAFWRTGCASPASPGPRSIPGRRACPATGPA